LQKYAVNIAGAKAAGGAIYPVIDKWSNGYLVKAVYSGSLSKGTAVNLGTDADIFISMSSNTPGTLSDLYNTLFNAVNKSIYPARKQNVSIGTTVNGYKLDLVPARRQSQNGNIHSLFKSKSNTWIQTNITTHINYVTNSNRTNEIKLTKIWSRLHGLDFPSLYLELAVIDSLKNAKVNDLENNFGKVIIYLRDEFAGKRFVDPANTNNVISDDLSLAQKQSIANKADLSARQRNWNQVVW
jgi:hypothetical protein